MRKLILPVATFILALTLFAPARNVQAQGGILSGTIDDSSDCLTAGFIYTPDVTWLFSPYHLIQFTVPTTASYTFSFSSKTISNDIFFHLYAGSFNPSENANTQASLVGWGNSLGANLVATLTAGTTYLMVTENFQRFYSLAECQGRSTTVSGTYTFNSSGPITLLGSGSATPATGANGDTSYANRLNPNHGDLIAVLYGVITDGTRTGIDLYDVVENPNGEFAQGKFVCRIEDGFKTGGNGKIVGCQGNHVYAVADDEVIVVVIGADQEGKVYSLVFDRDTFEIITKYTNTK